MTQKMFAWLLYGAMPAMAGHPMAMTSASVASASGHDHGETATGSRPCHASTMMKPDCPQPGDMAHQVFCNACLVLPPVVLIAQDGRAPVSHEAPTPAPGLRAMAIAPLDPPPRA